MYKTLKDGEALLLSKISYKLEAIKRFDIVVIKDIDNDLIIKRVIGLPGDTVKYEEDTLYINDEPIKEDYTNYIMDDFDVNDICKINDLKCNDIIPDDMYLVLGDNREVSADSRVKGLIQRKQILGKAIFRIWPLTKISKVN